MNPLDFQFETVYADLKQIAASRLRTLNPGQTLHATALVHEAYLRLIQQNSGNGSSSWQDRPAFFAAASEAMRRIIIDYYRKKTSQKRGGGFGRTLVDLGQIPDPLADHDLLDLEEALSRFELEYPEKAQVVKLRYFVGMTMSEIAGAMEISITTVERHWRFARAWLGAQLENP